MFEGLECGTRNMARDESKGLPLLPLHNLKLYEIDEQTNIRVENLAEVESLPAKNGGGIGIPYLFSCWSRIRYLIR